MVRPRARPKARTDRYEKRQNRVKMRHERPPQWHTTGVRRNLMPGGRIGNRCRAAQMQVRVSYAPELLADRRCECTGTAAHGKSHHGARRLRMERRQPRRSSRDGEQWFATVA